MKDILTVITIILLFVSAYVIKQFRIKLENQDEYIKLLEQSLNEQIQEKEFYMNLLEEKGK